MQIETNQYILEIMLSQIKAHNRTSGEIILAWEETHFWQYDPMPTISSFFSKNGITTDDVPFKASEISRQQAIDSIKFGLSTKPNYTRFEIELSTHDQNKLVYSFLQLFEQPTFYTIDTRIFKVDLNLNDFWESGGAIAMERKSIGIFWTNDLYDMF